MTIKEIRNLVAESQNREWLQSLTIHLNYVNLSEKITKTGISDIYSFYSRQVELWKKRGDDVPNTFKSILNFYEGCLNRLNQFINKIEQLNQQSLDHEWGIIQRDIIKTRLNNEILVTTSESPEVDFLINIHKKFPSSFNSAYNYLYTKRIDNINNPDFLRGLVLAYEFEIQDQTDLYQRRKSEKKSLGQIRVGFEKHLSEAESSTQKYLIDTKKNFEEHLTDLETLKNSKEELFDVWFGTSKQDFKTFYEEAKVETSSMKELFRDGLRFAGPVKHWRRRALLMKKDGGFWIKWFIGSTLVTSATLFLLLMFVPEDMNLSLFGGEPKAIKWTLLYITFISFMAYGVRTFAKLTFSSFHLARDAEEREQLTHVYLALKKDGNVEEEDRLLILQSIFSRAETGLLKDDSSPTMPGNLVEKFNRLR